MSELTLFVMRHAEATMMAQSDKERRLTAQGKTQARVQGQWLNNLGLNWDVVLVSPYARAQETFDEINQVFALQLGKQQEIWQGITPYGSAQLVEDYLQVLLEQGKQNVLLISHLPLVDEIVKRLCQQNPAKFYPATVVEIVWNGKLGRVEKMKYVTE